ncbi:MAG: hypothetical protein L0216_12460 [Planctomycetales bacterium]|nr:hypothetical protein [Planctomycetales bacterium]
MRKMLAAMAVLGLAAGGCGVYDTPDLKAGAVRGIVVDKIATVGGAEVVGEVGLAIPTWYLRVEGADGAETLVEVTHRAFQDVDTGDTLPDDLMEALPTLPGEGTPWR